MRIGEVSARTGLSIRTIRHYDHTGIAIPSGRSAGGFRLYSEADVCRLELVKTLRPLDMTLDQIRDLLEAMEGVVDDGTEDLESARSRMAMVRALADSKVESMRSQIAGLERLARTLRQIERRAEADSKR
ncbi:MerR family transcriptional regulator [Pseudonocardia saturnea]